MIIVRWWKIGRNNSHVMIFSLILLSPTGAQLPANGIAKAQKIVDNWIKEQVRYFDELTNMAQLTEEVGIARIIARGMESKEKESDKKKDLGEELADVIFVVLCLANQTGVDRNKLLTKK